MTLNRGKALSDTGNLHPSELAEYRCDPRRAITETGVICLICGHSFRHLTNTHLQTHGLTSSKYKERFGYNIRRALMIEKSRETHSKNAMKAGLASHIRRRSIFHDVEMKRLGGKRRHSLEESLNRQEHPRRFTKAMFRDQNGRFMAASAVAHVTVPEYGGAAHGELQIMDQRKQDLWLVDNAGLSSNVANFESTGEQSPVMDDTLGP